jgi:hypothetical protein
MGGEGMTDADNLIRRRLRREETPKEAALTPTPTPPKASQKATILVRGIKVAVPLPADAIPHDIVPPEGKPAGEPVIEVALEDGSVTAVAKLNGKSLRRALKTVAENGAANVALILQGTLRPGCVEGSSLVLSEAGLQVTLKQPKADGQTTPTAAP